MLSPICPDDLSKSNRTHLSGILHSRLITGLTEELVVDSQRDLFPGLIE